MRRLLRNKRGFRERVLCLRGFGGSYNAGIGAWQLISAWEASRPCIMLWGVLQRLICLMAIDLVVGSLAAVYHALVSLAAIDPASWQLICLVATDLVVGSLAAVYDALVSLAAIDAASWQLILLQEALRPRIMLS